MTATPVPRSGTNWPAPWACSRFWKHSRPSIRRFSGRGRGVSPTWAIARLSIADRSTADAPDSTESSTARPNRSTCWCIWSPATTARFASPCTRPRRIRSTATGTGADCRFAASARGTRLPSIEIDSERAAAPRDFAHAGARGNRAFDAHRGQLAGTLPGPARTVRASGLGLPRIALACRRRSRLAAEDQRSRLDFGGNLMTLHLHHLKGCSPAPLANYLKALGILRLIVEQAPTAKPAAGGKTNISAC